MLSKIYENSIFQTVVNTWNSLPNWVASANTTDTFKARLDKFWHNQDIVYKTVALRWVLLLPCK